MATSKVFAGISLCAIVLSPHSLNAAEERSLAIQWEGVQGLISGVAIRQDTATAQIKFFLSVPDRECNGTLSTPAKNPSEGVWAIACPDGLTASGQFTGKGTGKGGEGAGIDSKGRKVVFVVAPQTNRPQQTQQSVTPPSSPYPAPVQQPQQTPQVAVVPPPAPPTASTSTTLTDDPSNEVECGFVKVQGLPIQKSSVKCELSKRSLDASTSQGLKATLTARLPGKWFVLDAEKDEGNNGYKPAHSDLIRENFRRWVGSRSGKNQSDLIGSPFRHFKANITNNADKSDNTCVFGLFSGDKKGRSQEPVHYSWLIYCEQGTHTVSDENISKVYRAIKFN